MTKANAEFTDSKGNKVVLSIEEISEKIFKLEEADRIFDKRTTVTVNNGTERVIPVNEALAELWQMVYEIRNAIIFFIDLAKVYRPLIKFYRGYRPQIRGTLYFLITITLGGLVILGVIKLPELLQWIKGML